MFAQEPLVTPDSIQFFHTPGEMAKSLFFYPKIIGRYQYLIETRLSSAKFYLTTTDRTVSDIALSVGFGDESSFCLTFRKRVGMTPKAWRVKTNAAVIG